MSDNDIYAALWKPTTIKGVPRDYALVMLVACMLFAMILVVLKIKAGFYIGLGLYGVCWVIGIYLGKKDPEFLTVYLVKIMKIGITKGDSGRNEYI